MARYCKLCRSEVQADVAICPECDSKEFETVVQIGTAYFRFTNNFTYWDWAKKRFDVAVFLNNDYEGTAFPIIHNLLCESIELCFKAFLWSKGVDEQFLRKKIGHNLVKAHTRACENGLIHFCELSEDEETLLNEINEFYVSKRMDYWNERVVDATTGYPNYPAVEPLIQLAERLLSSLRRHCLEHGQS